MSITVDAESIQQKSCTLCIICNDARAKKWGFILAQSGRFSRIYLVLSEYDFQEISSESTDGSLIEEDQLPNAFDGILFHSSNHSLWQSLDITAKYIFEFNTPGDPKKREGVLPILRQTAPYFNIKQQDIRELSDYITEQRKQLPLCCTKIVQPQVLPGLACLFQLYFEQLEKGNQAIQPSFFHEVWGQQSGAEIAYGSFQKWVNQLTEEWKYQWRLLDNASVSKNSIDDFLKAVLTDSPSITPDLINQTYHDLRDKLGLQLKTNDLSFKQPEEIKSVISLIGSPASHALAKVLSAVWQVPQLSLTLNQDNVQNMQRDALLVLDESQVHDLKQMRLWGFAGAVLVISKEPFHNLKQRHRVLRFGQGSHKSFPAPWNLQDLLQDLEDMIPLAPENLQFLQQELKASQKLCSSHINPALQCLKHLDSLDGIIKNVIEELEEIVSKIRTDLPVACHATIIIKTHHGKEQCQIQEHFHAALKKLRSGDRTSGIEQFKQAFSQLQYYVVEAW
ncbi:MAG: hypothetical protein AAF572_14445 [Cyanobacteria bacterium P01_B01_bin.77]